MSGTRLIPRQPDNAAHSPPSRASMLYRLRRQLVKEGFEAVLSRKQRYRHRIRAGFEKFGRRPFPARQNRRGGPGQSQYPQQSVT